MSPKPLEWLWQLAAKKAISRGVQAFLIAYGAHLAQAGITVNEAQLISAVIGAWEFVRNWLKVKKGVTFL